MANRGRKIRSRSKPLMLRPQEWFAAGAVALLVFGLFSRFFFPNLSFAVQWRGAGYVFPLLSQCTVMAMFFCLFSAAYSLFMLPINQKTAMWHFWLTSAGVVVFWFSFLHLAQIVQSGEPKGSALRSATVWGQITSIAVILAAQAIFVVNLIAALSKSYRGLH